MHPPLRIGNVRAQLIETILLAPALSEQFILRALALLQLCFRRMPRMVRFLTLLECRLDATNQAYVFINYDTEGENVLLCLTIVELTNAELDV